MDIKWLDSSGKEGIVTLYSTNITFNKPLADVFERLFC